MTSWAVTSFQFTFFVEAPDVARLVNNFGTKDPSSVLPNVIVTCPVDTNMKSD